MNVLVIGAHRDDEVLGVGGTIAKHVAAGDTVFVCIVTKATRPQWSASYIKKKEKEQQQVDSFLGVRKRFFLDFPSAQLNTIPHGELNQRVAAVVDTVQPDVLYTHGAGDVHTDHHLVYRASLVAVRPPRATKILCYETLSETEWDPIPFQPTVWVDISATIETKIGACSLYQTEMKHYPHPRSVEGVRILAKQRGLEVCRSYCEAFSLVRDVS